MDRLLFILLFSNLAYHVIPEFFSEQTENKLPNFNGTAGFP
jgi:hypothetical protein